MTDNIESQQSSTTLSLTIFAINSNDLQSSTSCNLKLSASKWDICEFIYILVIGGVQDAGNSIKPPVSGFVECPVSDGHSLEVRAPWSFPAWYVNWYFKEESYNRFRCEIYTKWLKLRKLDYDIKISLEIRCVHQISRQIYAMHVIDRFIISSMSRGVAMGIEASHELQKIVKNQPNWQFGTFWNDFSHSTCWWL